MPLPSVDAIRERIEQVDDLALQRCLQALYLFAARITEVVGKVYSSDKTSRPRIARGPKKEDAHLDHWQEHEVALFNVYTAKRQGLKRIIALPLSFEPWAKILYEYFQDAKNPTVFPFTRQEVWRDSKPFFKGLNYPIDKYTIWKDGKLIKHVDRHDRTFNLHALRHLRATELVEVYGFDGFNLATYGGWKYQTMAKTTSVMDRYLSLSWQSYFPKLLKARK